MLEAESVQIKGSISYYSKFAVGLCLEVIAPSEKTDSSIEGSNHNNLLSVFEEVNFIKVSHSLQDILTAPEVQLFALVLNRRTVTQIASTIATFQNHFRPVHKVPTLV